MKQVFKTQQGIKVAEVSIPVMGENEILVKVMRSMISTGTETASQNQGKLTLANQLNAQKKNLVKLKKYFLANGLKKSYSFMKSKINPSPQDFDLSPIGYSAAGIVVSIGKKIMNFNIGDRVACAGSAIAAHAEYVSIPKNLAVCIPDNVSFEQAALTTIGSIALQGLRRANVTFGDTIVITGLGLIGLLAIQIAKAWGLNVIALDIDEERISLAGSFGADYAGNAQNPEIESVIKSLTAGHGADAVVICAATKSSEPVNQAMKLCRRKGTVTIVGAVGMNVERDQMYQKEIDLVMSTSYGPGRYDEQYELKGVDYPIGYIKWTENRNMMEFIRLLSVGKINVEPLINKTFSIEEADSAFSFLIKATPKPIGAMLRYNEDIKSVDKDIHQVSNVTYRKISSDKIRVGIIGAGGFVQGNHLPNLKELNSVYSIHAVCDKNNVVAANLTNKYEASYSTTDYQKIIDDKDIDFVIIGTRHNLHSKLAIECLQSGKHVLVEKPAAMTIEELDKLDKTVRSSNHHLTVGFNRRFSPFALKLSDLMRARLSPALITYRVNAGSYPINNWIHDPDEGGGRIIGEACHFIDFISFVADCELVNYKFCHIPLDGKVIQAHDNIVLALEYSDGSIGNLIYTSIGNRLLDKEKVEIYYDFKSIVLDNFISMQGYGIKDKDITLKKMDKGFKQELIEFAKVIRGEKESDLSWGSIYSTTKLTIDIMKQITG